MYGRHDRPLLDIPSKMGDRPFLLPHFHLITWVYKKCAGKTRPGNIGWLITWLIISAWPVCPDPWGLPRGERGARTTPRLFGVIARYLASSPVLSGNFLKEIVKKFKNNVICLILLKLSKIKCTPHVQKTIFPLTYLVLIFIYSVRR